MVGTLLGCLIVGVISNALNLAGIDSNWQLIAKGFFIVFAVTVDVISAFYFVDRPKRDLKAPSGRMAFFRARSGR